MIFLSSIKEQRNATSSVVIQNSVNTIEENLRIRSVIMMVVIYQKNIIAKEMQKKYHQFFFFSAFEKNKVVNK